MRSDVEREDLQHIWTHASGCLADLEGARLFLTGGTGFFGCWLLESVRYAQQHLGLNLQVVMLTRDPASFARRVPHLAQMPGLTLLTGDVVDFEFPGGAFTHVIHGATQASAQLNQEQPLVMQDTIVSGTRQVLEFAQQKAVKKFLFTSSGAIYGVQSPTVSHQDEQCMTAPDPMLCGSSYGLSKRLAEHLCATYAQRGEMLVKIARCFAFVGPYLPLTTHFAIGNFIHDAIHGQTIHVGGDGSPYRSYLYAADLMIWLWTILCCGESVRPYHVGSEEAIDVGTLAHVVAEQVSPQPMVEIAQNKTPGVLASRYVPSTQRARDELGLIQRISLEEGIQKTMRWYRGSMV